MKWTSEEHKTYVGLMMRDLRGSWGNNYTMRINECIESLEALCKDNTIAPSVKKDFMADIGTCIDERDGEDQDGRIFRDCATMYNYNSDEGYTDRVKKALSENCEYWEED